MLLKILIGLALLALVFAIIVARQPDNYRVTRTTTITAPASTVFPLVNDFRRWDSWSPWAKLDPEMKQTFEGPATGVGAVQTWSGNNKVGAGQATITESRVPELIRVKLEFLKPFESTSTSEFAFQPEGDRTVVTWTMVGDQTFVSKAFGLFINMDKMIGTDFEKGLAAMKTVAEAR
ncbi:MAG TPA: SRPBCC family protein [Candidatus Synoicihabitans sp.]|nr:SRPBCC family protein [Candidatus Synoicihabitans sp.]